MGGAEVDIGEESEDGDGPSAITASLESMVSDDSGSDTFARYRYQAKIILLQWLQTLRQDGPTAVYAEHVEDFVIVYEEKPIEFAQVKSRSTGRPFNVGDMAAAGGGIDALIRAFCTAKSHGVDGVFTLCLEGHTSVSKATQEFVDDPTAASDTTRVKLVGFIEAHGGDEADLDDFLMRLSVRGGLPYQGDIDDVLTSALTHVAPSITGEEIRELLSRLLEAVQRAQSAEGPLVADSVDPIGTFLDELLGASDGSDVPAKKRLTKEMLVEELPEDRAFLGPPIPPGPGGTKLEQKLRAAGAGDQLVADAQAARATSDVRRLEVMAGPEGRAAELEGLGERLLIQARAAAAVNDDAQAVWSELYSSSPEANDSQGLFRDRLEVIGFLCHLSDECRFAWVAAE